MEIHVNWAAIFVASLAYFFLGWAWYSALFVKPWMKEMGLGKKSKKDMDKAKKGMPKTMAIHFATLVVTAWVLCHIIHMSANMFQMPGLVTGLKTAFFVWLGFFATTLVNTVLWEGRSWKLYFINVGANFAGLLLMGAILGGWK
jgi:hypothetical protein